MIHQEENHKKSRNHGGMNQSISMGAPGINTSIMGSPSIKPSGPVIQLPRTQADDKPKQRIGPRVRASGKYGAKNEKEANRKV